ncbi:MULTISPECIES: recombinase family protein [unclassified Rhizobacter]|uniref:recombinase family protein n=1 Tax=unclassified Rhizobacter TaxID=2640088 RepID=UPI001F3A9E07|nr:MULTISPECIES: recombinase family protein [unclassified Rhizobacter]
MTLKACLYARYSTDKQSENSIDDQLRAARERVAREGWTITAIHADEGISGSTPVALRPGGKALLADALAKRFDVLVLEGLDRLSREISEAEGIVKRLEHRGLRIIGTADGYDTLARGRKVMRIARGLVNELYLDDLREKTHRGLAGQFDRGLSAGGRTYGYGSVEAPGGRRMAINEAEATTVRWIFERFADGYSTRTIAHELNARGTPSARGGTWAISALHGSSGKGLGMLNNELYIGRVVWNRRQWLKDPDTGRRRYIERPREEWQTRDAPELRIVTDELWQRVQTRARSGPARGTRTGKGAVPKTLFGGLLTCHACGGAIVAVNSQRYGCNNHRDRGNTVCSSSLTISRARLDKRLVDELRDELLDSAALAELQSSVQALLQQRSRDSSRENAGALARLNALEQEIGNLVNALATVGISPAIAARLKSAEAERAQLASVVQASALPDPKLVVDDVTARYRRMVSQLQEVLRDESDRTRTRQILTDMLGQVTIGRDLETGETFAELEDPAERLLVAAVGESLRLVAGAGFEPTTFGL